jgi:uncharacterized protein YjbI with pentapeptide repeats
MPTISVKELKTRYALGERNFENIDLQGANLQSIELEGINFTGSNFRGANLTDCNLQRAILNEVNFSEATLIETDLDKASMINANFDRANLANASLNETQLIGALLTDGAYLRGAYLIGAFLNNAKLTDAILTKANLMGAHLNGACLKRAQLTDAYLTGAYYNSNTQFDREFDPSKAGMFKISDEVEQGKTSISQLLDVFNHACQCSCKYLGNTITAQYLEKSKPNFEWLQQFQFDRAGKLTYSGSTKEFVTQEQLDSLQIWIDSFRAHCSKIIPEFSKMI